MVIMDAFQYLGTGMGVVAAITVGAFPSKIVLGLALSAVSCILLAAWAFHAGAWGVAISQTIYTPVYAWGMYTWLNKQKADSAREDIR